MMQKGQLEYAIRKAHENFDNWNEATGKFETFSGYYYEMLEVISDSVKIGSRVALGYSVRFDGCGKLIDDETKDGEI